MENKSYIISFRMCLQMAAWLHILERKQHENPVASADLIN